MDDYSPRLCRIYPENLESIRAILIPSLTCQRQVNRFANMAERSRSSHSEKSSSSASTSRIDSVQVDGLVKSFPFHVFLLFESDY